MKQQNSRLVTLFMCTCLCACCESGRDVGLGSADRLVHRVHSCTVYAIHERAFLILGKLRHRTAQGAAGTCGQKAHRRMLFRVLLNLCVQGRHTLGMDHYRFPKRAAI